MRHVTEEHVRNTEIKTFHTSSWVNNGKADVENVRRHCALNLLRIKKAMFGQLELCNNNRTKKKKPNKQTEKSNKTATYREGKLGKEGKIAKKAGSFYHKVT